MKIETKFKVGDKVFVIVGSRIIKEPIKGIKINIGKHIEIEYEFYNTDMHYVSFNRKEDQVFATKEELIASL